MLNITLVVLLFSNRSFRSESELSKRSNANSHLVNGGNVNIHVHHNAVQATVAKSVVPSESRAAVQPHHPQQHQQMKTHKSVSSLLTASNTMSNLSEHTTARDIYQNANLAASTQRLKCNCKLNEEIVTDLKKKLITAENKLTDIRLEALTSVHQIDQLKEYMEKMKNEMMVLKSENQLFKKYTREMKNDKVNISKSIEANLDGIKQQFGDENNKIKNLFDTLNSNFNNYYYSYDFLLGDENESLLRKVLVTIECSYQLNASTTVGVPGQEEFFVYKICTINIDSKLKWQLMDGIVAYVFKRFLSKIDSAKAVGLDKSSIDKYCIGDFTRKINDPIYPDLLPFGYLVGNNCTIKIILKGSFQFSLNITIKMLFMTYFFGREINIIY